MRSNELGPVYGVPLIDTLPFGSGGMKQQMPSRDDLEFVRKRNARVAAGYEVLLAHYREAIEVVKLARDGLRALATDAHFDHELASKLDEIITKGDA